MKTGRQMLYHLILILSVICVVGMKSEQTLMLLKKTCTDSDEKNNGWGQSE